MTSRTALRDSTLRRATTVSSALGVVALAATGGLLGALASPPAASAVPATTAVPAASPAAAPRPKRIVYVRVPIPAASSAAKSPVVRRRPAAVRPAPAAPRRAVTAPVTRSSGS
jgi:hypothetical protein